jgi:hypothetical protein
MRESISLSDGPALLHYRVGERESINHITGESNPRKGDLVTCCLISG